MGATQRRLVMQVARLFPDAVFYKETTQRRVALTFDDVPTPNEPNDESTGLILDAIAAHNRHLAPSELPVRATFFVITSHLNSGDILRRMQAEGHEIANHGIADDTTALQHPEIFSLQMREAHRCLIQHVDQPVRWYRPGRGLYNAKMLEILRRCPGYEKNFALASMLPVDTLQPTSDARFTAWYASQFIFPGSILLLHGGSRARSENTAMALPIILNNLKQQGYQVVTLSQLWDAPETHEPATGLCLPTKLSTEAEGFEPSREG